jgi:putative lipoprotein
MWQAKAKALICIVPVLFVAGVASAKPAAVTGTVTCLQRIALPGNAVIEVRLLDVSKADAPATTVAQEIIRPQGKQVPIPFTLKYDSSRINEGARYDVQARILIKDKLSYINTQAYPVITMGNPNKVEVVVEPVSQSVMPEQSGGSHRLENTHWILVEINGKPVEAGSTANEAYFELDSKGKRIQGSTGCNRLSGGYETEGDTLEFSKVVMTQMACIKGMEIEAAFSKALTATTKFNLGNDGLELYRAEGLLARFRAGAR